MDAQDFAALVQQAGIALAVFAPAAAALVALIRRFAPGLSGASAGTIAGLISVAAVVCSMLGAMPTEAYVVAAGLIAAYAPAVAYDAGKAVSPAGGA